VLVDNYSINDQVKLDLEFIPYDYWTNFLFVTLCVYYYKIKSELGIKQLNKNISVCIEIIIVIILNKCIKILCGDIILNSCYV